MENFLLASNGDRHSVHPTTSTVIGREEGDVLLADQTVSGRHARIEPATAGRGVVVSATPAKRLFTIQDLGSLNGTFLNGSRLEPGKPHMLSG